MMSSSSSTLPPPPLMRAATGFFNSIGNNNPPSAHPSSSSSSSSSSTGNNGDFPTALVYGGARKGAKAYQEDSYFYYSSPSAKVVIGGVLDGHGGLNGMIASNTARDTALKYFNDNKLKLDQWTVDEWKGNLHQLFDVMHTAIRNKFMEEQSTDNFLDGEKRVLDEKGIVRSSSGDPIHGGTTATLVVLIRGKESATIITANVGDSTALLLPSKSTKCEFLTVDHGPESPEEFARISALDNSRYPCKLLLVYDKTNVFRKYECPSVFKDNGEKDQLFVQNPWGNGLHPTNVRYEAAVYAVTPKSVSKDSTCIAMTRALGDFYAHQFGLTHIPSIGVKTVNKSTDDYTIILASDGIWDCWKYEDFTGYANELLSKKKRSILEVGEQLLEESIARAITNFGAKHYDDACAIYFSVF